MDRRSFLKRSGAGVALAGAAAGVGLGPWLAPRRLLAAADPDIAVIQGAPDAATRAAVEMLGGMRSVVRSGARVVIKPNMSFASPAEAGANTHPLVVKTLAALCWEAGASSVLILDNPLSSSRLCVERSGIAAAAEGVRPGMVYAVDDADHFADVPVPAGRAITRTEVVREVLKADVLIAAPTAKSHSGAGVSLSLKGMMGLIYNRGTLHWKGLDEGIADLCGVLRAHLTVIDATYVLSTGGPHGPGRVLDAKTVIASRDMVAADSFTVSAFPWYGRHYTGRQVGHIRAAAARGLGRIDVDALRVERLVL